MGIKNRLNFPEFGECLLPFDSKSVILPVVFYGCETWSLTLREEHRLRVLENGVVRRVQ
jgi:hypothetical protein